MIWACLIYSVASVLALPGITAVVWWRYVRRADTRSGLKERIGYLPQALRRLAAGREVLWIHAVSVGETMAAKPLVAALKAARPQAVVLLSQGTETGRAVARQAGADGVFYLPFDLAWVVRRTLRSLRPALLCVVDTELWPNLFWRAQAYGAKVVLVNGRISDRSLRSIRRWRVVGIYRWCLSHTDRLLMQSAADAERIAHLGGQNIDVVGNLKADEDFPVVDAVALASWQQTLGLAPTEPVLLAGSTGPGEESILLAAFATLRAEFPTARLILVPRAVDRAGEIEALVRAAGLPAVLRSRLPAEAERSARERAVVIVDTIGELAQLYAVGDVCFVGRSLVDLGGSNVLQAAAQGKPVLTGPYFSNMRDSVGLLTGAGAAVVVTSGQELAQQTAAWFGDPAAAAAVGACGRETVLASRGATQRCVEAIVELLDARQH